MLFPDDLRDNVDVTEDELELSVRELKNKAPNLHQIRRKQIKLIFPYVKDFLVNIYNCNILP